MICWLDLFSLDMAVGRTTTMHTGDNYPELSVLLQPLDRKTRSSNVDVNQITDITYT